MFWLVIAVLAWTLWITRSKQIIEQGCLSRTSDSIFKYLTFLQHSHPLSRQRDRDQRGGMLDALVASARRLSAP